MSAIILIGPSGTGKSAVVADLGERGWTAADVEDAVARRNGVTLDDFYVLVEDRERNEAIRAELHAFFDDIEAEPDELWALAIPSGGLGTSLDDDFRDIRDRLAALPQATIVRLSADLSTLVTRNGLIGPRSGAMVMPRKEFRIMMEARQPVYDSVATHVCDTTGRTPAESAEEIISFVHQGE